jgi:hypothetical protein
MDFENAEMDSESYNSDSGKLTPSLLLTSFFIYKKRLLRLLLDGAQVVACARGTSNRVQL